MATATTDKTPVAADYGANRHRRAGLTATLYAGYTPAMRLSASQSSLAVLMSVSEASM